MAMVKPFILQVVGFQNSGKTTMILKLIETFTNMGLKTATIKHHGHGGKPLAPEHKDSTKHLSAGAAASIVEGDGALILQAERSSFSLEDQIKLLDFINPDVILIEGHKQAKYPKLVIVRDQDDLSLLDQVSNCLAVVLWHNKLKNALLDVPCYSIHDETLIKKCTEWLRDWQNFLGNNVEENC